MTEKENLQGLRGWLILVGINVVLSPWVTIFWLVKTYIPIFSGGAWEVLTSPDSAFYHPFWKYLIAGELVSNSFLIAVMFFLNYLFFCRKKLFPRVFIALSIFMPAFIVMDALLTGIVAPEEPVFDPETMKELRRSVISALIWVPYMLMSKRVKATFIR